MENTLIVFGLFACLTFVTAFAVANEGESQSLSADQPSQRQSREVVWVRNIPYVTGGGIRQQLDLWIPRFTAKNGKKPPLLVWVHGGAWVHGRKNSIPAMEEMLDRGFALAAINYRYATQDIFPAQLEDCKSAIRWLRANADQYHFDPDRIGVWGSSAGGHLVALLGTTGKTKEFDVGEYLDQSSEVQAVVDFYGPTDFTATQQAPTALAVRASAVKVLLGAMPWEDPERARKASPIHHVHPASAPFLILHGDKDETVNLDQSVRLDKALRAASAECRLIVLENIGHSTSFLYTSPALDEIGVFFEKHLMTENGPK